MVSQDMTEKDNLCRQVVGQFQQQALAMSDEFRLRTEQGRLEHERALLQQQDALTRHLAANQNLAEAEKRTLIEEANVCLAIRMTMADADHKAELRVSSTQSRC